MCGILGYISLSEKLKLSDNCFKISLQQLQARGPDANNIVQLPGIGYLGHTRLAILDLNSRASQPFSDQTRRFTIVYNGEVYNYLELRKELIQKGYQFLTRSDTEVVLYSFLEWGENCQNRFNGMWAFAIWDNQEKKIFLSRDRFGIKPLYIYHHSNKLIFGSELKALTGLIDSWSFDDEAIAAWISSGDRFESVSKTIIKGVEKILPGECAWFSSEGFLKKKWWNTLDASMAYAGRCTNPIETLRELFIDACKIRLRSDVPLASALSGGIDSSSVVSIIAQLLNGQRFCSFIVHYPNSQQDELQYALEVVKKYKIESQIIESRVEDCLSYIDDVIFASEDGVNLPTGPYLMYRMYSKSGMKISIDGHGADELFGGYIEYPLVSLSKIALKIPIFDWVRSMRVLNGMSYMSPLKLIIQKTKHRFFRSAEQIKLPNLINFSTDYHFVESTSEIQNMDPISQRLYMDFHYWTLPAILRRFDRCSMTHGVEVRSPFLDWRIVAFAHALPLRHKLSHGMNKYIVRKMMQSDLPKSIYQRKKKLGFTNPDLEWFGQKKLMEYMLDASSSMSLIGSRAFDGRELKTMIEKACREKNVSILRSLWPFFQMSRLQELLSKQRELVSL